MDSFFDDEGVNEIKEILDIWSVQVQDINKLWVVY